MTIHYVVLASNFQAKYRKETLNGREHWVVPVTLIVPGVLAGNQGPVLYTHDEIRLRPGAWNGMPLTLDHPKDGNNQPITARQPSVLNDKGLGVLLNATVNGKLSGEAWFDVENTRRVEPEIIKRLEKGDKVEISTGLYMEIAKQEGTHNESGKHYEGVARNIQPDHVAILPFKKGACSVDDGCGVNNEESQSFIQRIANFFKGKQGALAINEDGQLHVVPTASVPSGEPMKLNEKQRKEHLDFLVANCSCWTEDDRETLNNFDDEKLVAMRTDAAQAKADKELVANAKKGKNAGGVEDEEDEDLDKGGMNKKGKNAKGKNKDMEEDEDKPTGNAKPQTMQEWLKTAPPEAQRIFNNALAIENAEKLKLIEAITANEQNPYTEEQLKAMTVDALRPIAQLAGATVNQQPTPLYGGAATPVDNLGGRPKNWDAEDVLLMPTMNEIMEEEEDAA